MCFIKIEHDIENIYAFLGNKLYDWIKQIEKKNINEKTPKSWYTDNFETDKCSVYWLYIIVKDQPSILNIEICKL